MKIQNIIEKKQCNLDELSFEEMIETHGGGFWEDFGELVGSGARFIWENYKRNPSTVRTVGPGVVI